MDLWIRSQGKGALIKVEILGNTNGTINAYSNNNKIVLGEYSSDERALEVLDEIQKAIEDGVFKEKYEEGNGCYIGTKIPIYEMPKE